MGSGSSRLRTVFPADHFFFREKRNGPHPPKKACLGSCRVLLSPAPKNTVTTGALYLRALRPACFLLSGRDSPPPGRLGVIWTAAFQRPPGRPRVSRQGDIGGIYSGIYSGNAVAISPSVCGDCACWHGDFAICKLTPYRARISSLGNTTWCGHAGRCCPPPFLPRPPRPAAGWGRKPAPHPWAKPPVRCTFPYTKP